MRSEGIDGNFGYTQRIGKDFIFTLRGNLTYAYNNGIVTSNKIDLTKPITRLEMAELAAKALGLSPETSIKTGIIRPTDTTNGYVYALYNRGIVGGDSSSGKNLYLPGSTLLRDEMAKIVCGVMDQAK